MRDVLPTSAPPAGVRLAFAVLAALLLTSVALVRPASTSADVAWCWDDPAFQIEEFTLSVDIGVQGTPEAVKANVQLAETVFYLPKDVEGEQLSLTNVYFPETARFVHLVTEGVPGDKKGIDVTVAVSFKATKDMPSAMVIKYRGAAIATTTGTTFGTMQATFTLQAGG